MKSPLALLRSLNRADVFLKPIGVVNGKLRDCPATPNCVCTEASRKDQKLARVQLNSDKDFLRIEGILIDQMGGRLEKKTADYLHVEFTSKLLGFVDDFEVLWDRENKQLQIRSASRVGRSDLGANRKRTKRFLEFLGFDQ